MWVPAGDGGSLTIGIPSTRWKESVLVEYTVFIIPLLVHFFRTWLISRS